MAEFGIKATQMSAADTKAAKFVKQPVQDNSKNILLGAGLDLAGQAFEGYQMASLEKEQEAVIDDYMTGRGRKEAIDSQTFEAATLKDSIDSIWEKAGSVEELDQKAGPVEKEFQGRMEKLKMALDQGAMTPDQFQTQILATTRKAVNQTPGLYDKLLAHSKKVLGLSGIDSVLAADIAAQKAQDDSLKNLRELADKLNVGYNHFNPDYNQMQASVLQRQREVSASDQLTRGLTAGDALKREDALTFIANEGTNAILGDSFTLKSTAAAMFQGATPQDYPQIKNKLRMDIDARRNALVAQTNKLGIRNEAEVKTYIEDYDSSMKMLLDTIEGLESGADAQKAIDHAYGILVGSQKIGMARQYNIGALETLRLFPDSVLNSVMADEKSGNFAKFSKLAQSVFDGAVSNGETREFLTTTEPGKAPVAVEAAFGTLEKEKDPEKLGAMASNIINFSVDAANPDNFKTEEDQTKYLDSVFKKIGDPKLKEKFKDLDTQALGNMFKLTDQYFQRVGEERAKLFNETLDTGILGIERSIPVYAEITPDGRVIFQSPDAKTQKKFNDKFAGRINLGISATANLMGISKKEATAELLPRYRQIWGIETNIDTGIKPITGAKKAEPDLSRESMKISPEVQAKRDETRLRVLNDEISEFRTKLLSEKDPEKRKMFEDNIRFVTEELKQLGQ